MVLENVKEMWTETPRLASGKKGRPVNKDRFISKLYVLFSKYFVHVWWMMMLMTLMTMIMTTKIGELQCWDLLTTLPFVPPAGGVFFLKKLQVSKGRFCHLGSAKLEASDGSCRYFYL